MALTDNIFAYYKMDEASGATRNDSTANALNLTNNGTVGAGTGIINNGANSWSSANYLSRANNTNWDFTGAFSINFWIWASTFQTANACILNKNGSGIGDGWSVYHQANGGAVLLQQDGVNNYISNTAYSTSTWYMSTFTCSGALGTINIYQNATTDFTPTTIVSPTANTNEFWIGKNRGAGASQPLSTSTVIDEVGFWTRELSGAEITTLYNGGAGLQYPFTVAGGPSRDARKLTLLGVG